MKLFHGAGNWEDRLTAEDLDKMEANGQDVSELRKKLADRLAKEEKSGETDRTKLSAYAATPRSTSTEFFKDIAGKGPLFGKKKHFEKYENAKFAYPVVVQAAPSLYKVGDDPSAAIIVVYGLDDANKEDFDTLRTVADLLVAMRNGEVEVPKALKKLVKDLNNPSSHINTKLDGADIASDFVGARFLVDTVYTEQAKLPNKRIPNDRVLVMLDFQKDGSHDYYEILNGKWYIA